MQALPVSWPVSCKGNGLSVTVMDVVEPAVDFFEVLPVGKGPWLILAGRKEVSMVDFHGLLF